jgi:hypothetical protein
MERKHYGTIVYWWNNIGGHVKECCLIQSVVDRARVVTTIGLQCFMPALAYLKFKLQHRCCPCMCHTCKYSRGDNNTLSVPQRVPTMSQTCLKLTGFRERSQNRFSQAFPNDTQTMLGNFQLCPKTIPKPGFENTPKILHLW